MAKVGKALVERIIADLAARGLEPDAKERELLAVAEGLADQLDGLRKSVAAHGYSTVISSGRVVINPAVAAIRQASLALTKVLDGIEMTDAPPVDRTKQRAAHVRWRAHREAKAAMPGGC